MRRSERGSIVAESVIALGVVTILVTAAMGGVVAHARAGVLSRDALRVRAAASSRLETAPQRALAPGLRRFDPEPVGLAGEEEVREVSPGLLEVTVRVRAASGVAAEMATRVATEEKKP